jgi:hypothetical protein
MTFYRRIEIRLNAINNTLTCRSDDVVTQLSIPDVPGWIT